MEKENKVKISLTIGIIMLTIILLMAAVLRQNFTTKKSAAVKQPDPDECETWSGFCRWSAEAKIPKSAFNVYVGSTRIDENKIVLLNKCPENFPQDPNINCYQVRFDYSSSPGTYDCRVEIKYGTQVCSVNHDQCQPTNQVSIVDTQVIETQVVETKVIETQVVETQVVETQVVNSPIVTACPTNYEIPDLQVICPGCLCTNFACERTEECRQKYDYDFVCYDTGHGKFCIRESAQSFCEAL